MEVTVGKARLELVVGDITAEGTEALVNAANSGLRGGGGVDGAIHRAGGPVIMEECRKIGFCPPGQAVLTTAGRLKARYVIHTVGPVYQGGAQGEDRILQSAYCESLKLASAKRIRSLAFPALSAGAYGYPLREAARIALRTIVDYLKEHEEIDLVRFVLFDHGTYAIFVEELRNIILLSSDDILEGC